MWRSIINFQIKTNQAELLVKIHLFSFYLPELLILHEILNEYMHREKPLVYLSTNEFMFQGDSD